MNLIDILLSSAQIEALGWSLINTLWQSLIVLTVLVTVLKLLSPKYARTRYYMSYFSILLVLGLFLKSVITNFEITAESVQISHVPDIQTIIDQEENTSSALLNAENESGYFQTAFSFLENFLNQNINYFVMIWFAGIFVLGMRLAGGFYLLKKLKNSKLIDVPTNIQSTVLDLCEKLGLEKCVTVGISKKVESPITIGYFKPMILLPIEVITAIPRDQIEIILAHELAHIARADYLLNIFQTIIETVFFFNPTIWIISNIIKREREYCCDDLAVKLCGNKEELAKALYNINAGVYENRLALSFANKNNLMGRIKRMLNQKQNGFKNIAVTIVFVLVSTFMIYACSHSGSSYSYSSDYNGFTNSASFSALEDNNDILSENFGQSSYDYDYNGDGKRTIIFYSKFRGDKVKWKVKVNEDDEITSLYIDGDKIDSDDFHKYEDIIQPYIEEEQDEYRYHYSYDYDFDFEELADALSEMENIHVDVDFDSEAFSEAMAELSSSLSDISVDIKVNSDEINREIRDEMRKARHELRKSHRNRVRFNFDSEAFAENLSESIGNIDIDIDLSDLEESLADLHVDLEHLKRDLKKLENFMDDVRDELYDEGIIDDRDEHFEMDLSATSLYINGEIMSRKLHKKLLEHYEDNFGKEIDEEHNFTIN